MVLAIIFPVISLLVGLWEWNRFNSLRTEVKDALTEVGDVQKGVRRSQQDLAESVSEFQANLELQEQRLASAQRYLEAVWSQYSNLLVGIASGLTLSLGKDGVQRFRSQISEADACMNLFHPDEGEVKSALYILEQIGADNAVAPLARLRDDESVSREIYGRARDVLDIVCDRIREQENRQKTATQT